MKKNVFKRFTDFLDRLEKEKIGYWLERSRDETLHDAIARMLRHNVGRLPVVERSNRRKVVGYLGRASILAARERYHHAEEVRERGFG